MEPYFAAPPGAREPALTAFIKKADELYPDWRDTWEAKERDGTVLRALAIHCVRRIRERSDLDELDRLKAKEAEADFVMSFDEVKSSPNSSAAFRMGLALGELMRIAKLDPEEMIVIERRALSAWRRNGTLRSAETRRKNRDAWQEVAKERNDPNLAINDLTAEMLNEWPQDVFRPGPETLAKFLRDQRRPPRRR
jgi:hypothetical protein